MTKRYRFTRRQMDLLKVLAEGYGNAEIANRLFITKRSVISMIVTIREKTGAKNRSELIEIARTICWPGYQPYKKPDGMISVSSAVAHLQMAIDILNTLKETA